MKAMEIIDMVMKFAAFGAMAIAVIVAIHKVFYIVADRISVLGKTSIHHLGVRRTAVSPI